MKRERSYLAWLGACAVGAGTLVGVAAVAGSDATPSASRSVVANCRGVGWVTPSGGQVCIQSAPFAVDPNVLRRIAPDELRRLFENGVRRGAAPGGRTTPFDPNVLGRLRERLGRGPNTDGGLGDLLPTGAPAMSSFRSSSMLQVPRPCQDTSTF